MSTFHFHQTTTSTPEQFIAGADRLRAGPLGDLRQQRRRLPRGLFAWPHGADVKEGSKGIWERLHYDWSDPNRVVLTTTDSNIWGGASGHTYTLKPLPDGKTEVDLVTVREGKNLKGRILGFFVGTVGKGTLRKRVREQRQGNRGPKRRRSRDEAMTRAGELTHRVAAGNGIEYAYRDLGDSDVPLVLLQHFRGNLDNWDPALVDALAVDRRVVAFDNTGVGATTGTTPSTVEAMAHDAVAFLEALNLERVDLLGFSLGSFVAQEIALIRPDLLRRVVLASSAPQGAAGMHGWAPDVIAAVGQPETSPAGLPVGVLRPHRHQSCCGPGGRRAHLRKDDGSRRTDDLADPPGAVRRRVRLGIPTTRCFNESPRSISRCSSPTETATP